VTRVVHQHVETAQFAMRPRDEIARRGGVAYVRA
jgi:hypothetical protein